MAIVTRDKHGIYTRARRDGEGAQLDRKTARYHAVTNRGKTWSAAFMTRKDAEAEELRLKQAQNDGTAVGKDRITVNDFIDKIWSPHQQLRVDNNDLDANTLQSYVMQIDCHIRPKLGEKKLRDVGPHTLQSFYSERKKTRGWQGSKSMINLHVIMHGILELAVERDYLARNAAAARGVRPGNRTTEKVRNSQALTRDEIGRLLAVTDEDRLFAAWRLLVVGGLRRGEVLGLEWRDVDFKSNRVRLDRTWKLLAQTRERVIGPIKTGRPRTVPLDQATMDVLRAHKARQAEERLLAGIHWQDCGAVFTDEVGRRVNPPTFSRQFGRLLETAVRKGHLHELRHTAVTHALRNGMDIAVAADRFGHSPSVMLDIYNHISKEDAAAGAEIAATIAHS